MNHQHSDPSVHDGVESISKFMQRRLAEMDFETRIVKT